MRAYDYLMILTMRKWRDGQAVPADTTGQLPSREVGEGELLWVDLADPTPAELRSIGKHFGLTPLGMADVLEPHERTKVVRHPDHLSFVCYAAVGDTSNDNEDQAEAGFIFNMVRVSGFVFERLIITVRANTDFSVDTLQERWLEEQRLVRLGPSYLIYSILDTIVDEYFNYIETIEDRLEDIEDLLFEKVLTNEVQQRLYNIRRDLSHLRRAVSPMRELVIDFARHFTAQTEMAGYYDDTYDHALRASEWIDSLRDTISFIVETNLSLQDTRMNEIMKKLAAWAAIISVPTLVTSYFGQNLPFFGFNEHSGLIVSSVLLVGSAIMLWAAFRKSEWL